MNQHEVMIKKLEQYDSSFEYDMGMYDKLPYHRDVDTCNSRTVRMESGNVFKSYAFNVEPEPYVYKAPDIVFPPTPVTISEDSIDNEDNDIIEEAVPKGVTPEQLDTLLTDSDIDSTTPLAS